MGPECPSCGAIYEWTTHEVEEDVYAPKIYFCQCCRHMFILAPEEIQAVQEQWRPSLADVDQADIEYHEPPEE